MFVRWKRRKPKRRNFWAQRSVTEREGDSLYAVLVKAERVNGRPRQKVICYLRGVHEKETREMYARIGFWSEVTRKLDALQLGTTERVKIESTLDRTVPRPSETEALQYEQEIEAFFHALRNKDHRFYRSPRSA